MIGGCRREKNVSIIMMLAAATTALALLKILTPIMNTNPEPTTPPHIAVRIILARGQTSARGKYCEEQGEIAYAPLLAHIENESMPAFATYIGRLTHPIDDLRRSQRHRGVGEGTYRALYSTQTQAGHRRERLLPHPVMTQCGHWFHTMAGPLIDFFLLPIRGSAPPVGCVRYSL